MSEPRTDSERYRWLRSQIEGKEKTCTFFDQHGSVFAVFVWIRRLDHFDELIDASIDAEARDD